MNSASFLRMALMPSGKLFLWELVEDLYASYKRARFSSTSPFHE